MHTCDATAHKARWRAALCAAAMALGSMAAGGAEPSMGKPADSAAKRPVWWPALVADMERVRLGNEGAVPADYESAVRRAEAVGARLHEVASISSPPDEAAQALVARAERMRLPRCRGMVYQAVYLPPLPASPGGPLTTAAVYLLGDVVGGQHLVAGVHHRLPVTADGRSFDAVDASTDECMVFETPLGTSPKGHVIVRPFDCLPDEFQVRMSLQREGDVVVVTSVGQWLVRHGRVRFISEQVRPCAQTRAGASIHRWIALPPQSGDESVYSIAMTYMDWQAGPSMRFAGKARLDADGRWTWVQKNETATFTARMADGDRVGQPVGYVLAAGELKSLELDAEPGWLAAYRSRAPKDETVQIASFFNHHGDSWSAIALLEAAAASGVPPSAQGAFELGYAYNVARRFDGAVRVLRAAEKNHPEQPDICRELGFALVQRGDTVEAVAQYERCWPLMARLDAIFRLEIAARQTQMYADLRRSEACARWHDLLQHELQAAPQASIPAAQLAAFRAVRCGD